MPHCHLSYFACPSESESKYLRKDDGDMLETAISQRTMGARHLAHDCSTIADTIAAEMLELELDDDHEASLKPCVLRGLEDIKQMLRNGVDMHRSTERHLLERFDGISERCDGISVLHARIDGIKDAIGASLESLTTEGESMKQLHQALIADMSSTKRDLAKLESKLQGLSSRVGRTSGTSSLESSCTIEKKLAGKDLATVSQELDALKSQMEDLRSYKLPTIEAVLRSEIHSLRNEVTSQPSEFKVGAVGEPSEPEAFRRDIEERLCTLEVVSLRSELGTFRREVEERLRDLGVVSANSEVAALGKDVESRLHHLEERPLVGANHLLDEKISRLEEDLVMVRGEMASLEKQILEEHADTVGNAKMEIAEQPWEATDTKLETLEKKWEVCNANMVIAQEATNTKIETLEEKWEAANMKMESLEEKWEAVHAKTASVQHRLEVCKAAAHMVGDRRGSDDQESFSSRASITSTASQDALDALKHMLDNRLREHSYTLTAVCMQIGSCEESWKGLHADHQSMLEHLQGLDDDLSVVRAELASLRRVQEDGPELKMDIIDMMEVMDSHRKELTDMQVPRSRDMEATVTTTKDVIEQMLLDWSSDVEGAFKQSVASVRGELEAFKVDVVDKHCGQSLSVAEIQNSVSSLQGNISVLRKMLQDLSIFCRDAVRINASDVRQAADQTASQPTCLSAN